MQTASPSSLREACMHHTVHGSVLLYSANEHVREHDVARCKRLIQAGLAVCSSLIQLETDYSHE